MRLIRILGQLLPHFQENIGDCIILILENLVEYESHLLIVLLNNRLDDIIILFDESPSRKFKVLIGDDSAYVLDNITKSIVVVVRKWNICLTLSNCLQDSGKVLVIIADLLFLDLLPYLFCGFFFMDRLKVVIDDLSVSFCDCVPRLDDLHSLSNAVIERKNFFKLSNQ